MPLYIKPNVLLKILLNTGSITLYRPYYKPIEYRCSSVPLEHGPKQHDIAYIPLVTDAEHESKFEFTTYILRADSRLAPSPWETSLKSNAVSHWLGANLESALIPYLALTG